METLASMDITIVVMEDGSGIKVDYLYGRDHSLEDVAKLYPHEEVLQLILE